MKYPTVKGSARACLVCLLITATIIFLASALNVLAGNVALNKPATAGSTYYGYVPAGGSHIYELFGSLDDTNWTHLAAGISVDTLAPVKVNTGGGSFRYLRCDVTGGSDWASLAELEAYPVAAISTITVNSGVVQLTLTNRLSDVTNTIERTFDLTDPFGWNALTNLAGVSGGIVWEESTSNEWTRAFYRVRSK